MRVLGLALAAAVLSPGARGADVDKYLPADAEWVASINVRQILDSAVVKKYGLPRAEAELKKNDAQKFLSQIGLDPMKDVETVTIAGPESLTIQTKWVVIVHGTFNLGKIRDAAEAFAKDKPKDLKIEKEGDVPIYESRTPAPRRGAKAPDSTSSFAAFLDKGVLVVSGSRDTLLDAVAKHAGKKESQVGKEMQALIRKQDSLKSVWMAGLATEQLKKQLAKNPQTSEFADKVQSLSGSIDLGDGVKADFRVHTSEKEAAEKIKDLLDGARSLAIFAIGTQPQLKQFAPVVTEVLKAFDFSQDKGSAIIALTITSGMIEKGIKLAKEPPAKKG
jgi:hypothetical protein